MQDTKKTNMPIKDNFPEAGSNYMEGQCDGWEYKTVFSGSSLKGSYDMLRQFLKEEGYTDVPLPVNDKELLLFKSLEQTQQLVLYRESGYVHNPIKILFHPRSKKENTLILCIYNEQAPNHLLRFHGVYQEIDSK